MKEVILNTKKRTATVGSCTIHKTYVIERIRGGNQFMTMNETGNPGSIRAVDFMGLTGDLIIQARIAERHDKGLQAVLKDAIERGSKVYEFNSTIEAIKFMDKNR